MENNNTNNNESNTSAKQVNESSQAITHLFTPDTSFRESNGYHYATRRNGRRFYGRYDENGFYHDVD